MFETNSDWAQYPANIERTAEGRYKKYYPANVTDRPKNIFMGPEAGTVTFDMYLDQRLNGNIRDLLAMIVSWVNSGYAGELVIGTKVYGHNKWVCKKVVQKFIDLLPGGIIASAVIQVTLEEC